MASRYSLVAPGREELHGHPQVVVGIGIVAHPAHEEDVRRSILHSVQEFGPRQAVPADLHAQVVLPLPDQGIPVLRSDEEGQHLHSREAGATRVAGLAPGALGPARGRRAGRCPARDRASPAARSRPWPAGRADPHSTSTSLSRSRARAKARRTRGSSKGGRASVEDQEVSVRTWQRDILRGVQLAERRSHRGCACAEGGYELKHIRQSGLDTPPTGPAIRWQRQRVSCTCCTLPAAGPW